MMAWFERLSTREKYAVAVAIVLAFGLGVRFFVHALFGDASRNKQLLAVRTKDLQAMEALTLEYQRVRQTPALTSSALKRGETLYAFLDEMAGGAGIRSKVSYMKPSQVKSRDGKVSLSVVEMKVVDLAMGELTTFLHRVETAGEMIRIRGISLTRLEKSKLLTAVISIETVTL